MGKTYYVYIMTNVARTVLYTGVTGNLFHRVIQHKNKDIEGFTKQYHVDRLVYFEEFAHPISAIVREKQIKKGSRKKKEELIKSVNKKWQDLSLKFF